MKTIIAITICMTVSTVFASNYPADYCHANVKVCKDGPGVVAQISSGCNSGVYIIGYKKQGKFGNDSFVDAVVNFKFGNNLTAKSDFRITPDWNNLGFLTPGINLQSVVGSMSSGPLTEISIGFSDGNGAWDSNGTDYHYPIGAAEAPNCYSVKTNEDYFSQVPFAAWSVVNEAMRR